ncbi:MAG: hypothetical protein DI535_21305 [Citrobacter freundii]|nr:MAG: hypothetical protein DI535_21305 [Citrobacter freundii]
MRHTLLILAAFASLIMASCGGSSPQPVTKEDAEKFSKEIDSSINYKNPKLFTSLIDLKELSKRVQKNSVHKISGEIEEGIASGLEKTNMGAEIIKSIQDKGTYELVKHYEKDGVQHLIYRIYSQSGLNYHDYELVKRNGKVSIADFYIYTAGETFSSLLGNFLNLMDARNISKQDEDYKAMMKVQEVKQLMASNPEEAKRIYDGLPEKFRNQKMVRLLGVQLSANLDNETYLAQLEDFEKTFPDEPNTHLIMLDAAILSKDYDKAISHIDKIDELINKDPFLDFYRALMYNLKQEPAKARERLELLAKNYPDFEAGQLELLANYLEAKDYDKAKDKIAEYRKNAEFDKDLLEQVVSGYPDYKE